MFREGQAVSDDPLPIVVGVNGSAQALGAARWAGALAERLGAPLHLVMAVPTASHDPSAAHHAVGIDAAAMILSAAVEFVRDDHPGLVVTTASTSILAEETFAAASRTARLLVLGCDDVTAVGALLIGSTTLATVAQARCPVVAWRGSATEPNRKAIVVDFDGLPEDGGALGLAFALADRLEAPLQAVYCWPQHPLSRTLTGPIDIEWNAATQAQFAHLNHLLTPWRQRYPRVDAMLVCEANKPSYALLLYSDTAQLVVLGGRRNSALDHPLLGSTALNLLHHSQVPVVLCPAITASSAATPSDRDEPITG
jgi:nucleotide-binding universal stress UspA family protein